MIATDVKGGDFAIRHSDLAEYLDQLADVLEAVTHAVVFSAPKFVTFRWHVCPECGAEALWGVTPDGEVMARCYGSARPSWGPDDDACRGWLRLNEDNFWEIGTPWHE